MKHSYKFRSYLFLFSAIVAAPTLAKADPAGNQASVGAPPSSSSVEVIVTGTRRGERTKVQSLAPVDVVGAKTLALSPSADLDDKLAASVPSFDVQREPGLDGAMFNRPATLRNLSPDETLVLVNGHRRHRSAFVDIVNQGAEAVDLSQIPSEAIGHLEVLRDGASAQYGSDAIAGVINIILDDTPGTVLTAQGGQYYAGDGFGSQISGKTGFVLPKDGIFTVSGDYNHSEPTNRSIGIKNEIGQPDLESSHLTFNLKQPLNSDTQLYAFGTLSHGTGWNQFSYRSAQDGDSVFGTSYFQTGTQALYPTWTLTSIYPNGMIPRFGVDSNDSDLVAGVTRNLASNLSVDISGSYGRNSIGYRVRDSINASLGPLSPTAFNAGTIIASESTAAIDAVWKPDVGLSDPLNVGFGVDYRDEAFQEIAGDTASYTVGPLSDLPSGSYGFPGLSPTSAGKWSRHSEAAYFDAEADLTSKLTVGAAGRYEDYSDFGSNFSYKISGRYQLAPGIALRSTYNTGFHAPAPGQEHFTKVSSEPDPTQPPPPPIIEIALVSPTNPIAVPYGGKALKPEKSQNFSSGLVLQPTNALTVTVDYYHVRINDRIGLTPQITLPAGSSYNAIQFLTNGYDTITDGADLVASWSRQLAAGRLSVTGAYNYNSTRVVDANPLIVNKVTRAIIDDGRPHHAGNVAVAFEKGRLHTTARVRYYGSFVDAVPFDQSPFVNQKIPAVGFVDLSVAYDVTRSTQFTVGAENLFNKYPARNTSLLSLLGYEYQLIRPYDEDGGRWYARVTQKF